VTLIQRSALLPYLPEQVFRLVNDITAYPSFMQGCVGASILEQSDDHMVARLDLARAGIAYSLTTRNALHPWEAIDIQLEKGPFDHFHGRWQFQQLGDAACKVMLELRFAMAGAVRQVAMGKLFELVGNNLVDALCARARQLYG